MARRARTVQELSDGYEILDHDGSFFLARIKRPSRAPDENSSEAHGIRWVNIAVDGISDVDSLGDGPTRAFESQSDDRWVGLIGASVL